MALQTLVKISGVTNLSDARYCAGMGVAMLGFGMDADAPDYIDAARCAEIRGWVSGVQIVGETGSTNPEHIRNLLAEYQPDVLQINDPALLPLLTDTGKPLILRRDLAQISPDDLDILTLPTNPDYLLLDGSDALPLGHEWLHAILLLSMRYPVLLGTGLHPDIVQTLLDTLPIKGIALAGGREERPGYRDFGTLMDILELLEVES